MRRPSVAPPVFGIVMAAALLVPIVAFAVFTSATIQSDVSVRVREDREVTARLAAVMLRQRFEGATADLAHFAARPALAGAARARNGDALEALLNEFANPAQFQLVGVVDPRGEVVARVPAGPVDPTFAADVAAKVAGTSTIHGIFLGADERAPFSGDVVGAVVMPFDVGDERFGLYGMLSFAAFASVLLPVSMPPGRALVLLDENGRVIVAASSSKEPVFAGTFYSADPALGYRGRPLEIPGRREALANDFGSDTLTIDGRERLAVHVAVLPGHWVLYLLDTAAIALAGERRLTEQLIIGAAVAAAVAAGLAAVLAVLVGRLRRQRIELVKLAITEERLRFARDLHDLLGRGLSLIAMKSELALRLVRDNAAAAEQIGDVERVAREALRDVRGAVGSYREPRLEAELAGARSALAAAGIECRVERHGGELPEQIDALFAWTVREGVTNVIRHSGAGRCEIRVSRGERDAQVDVTDDGVAAGPRAAGYGLLGLQERAAARGGVAEAGPLPTAGFRLHIAVPLLTPS